MKWLPGIIISVWFFATIIFCLKYATFFCRVLFGIVIWCRQHSTLVLRWLRETPVMRWLLGPPSMRWLHLSDIHFCPRNQRNAKQLRDKLYEYIKTKNIRVDHIFLTGDFRKASLKREVDDMNDAAEFIRKIAASAGVTDMSRVHLVPGNHDLDRCGCEKKDKTKKESKCKSNANSKTKRKSTTKCNYKPIIDNQYDSDKGTFTKDAKEDANENDVNYKNKEKLFNRFGFFTQLRKELGASGIKELQLHYNERLHGVRCKPDEDFNLLYLNTAIASYDDDERGKLVIGNNDVFDALQEIKSKSPDKPIIVLAHHSLDCFSQQEREAVRDLFNSCNVLLYLCGDAHRSSLQTTNEVLEVTMGCLTTGDNSETVFSNGELWKGNKLSITAHRWGLGNWSKYDHFNRDIKNSIRNLGHNTEYYLWVFFVVVVLVFLAMLFWWRIAWLKPEINEEKLNIAQLPGLNGNWWFEETPWLIPPVREKLMWELNMNYYRPILRDKDGVLFNIYDSSAHPRLKDKYGKDLNLFDSSVAGVQKSLWDIIEPFLREKRFRDYLPFVRGYCSKLSPQQRELVKKLHESSSFVNSGIDDRTFLRVSFINAMESFKAGIGYGKNKDQCSEVDLHTLANLCHRIALLSEKQPDSVKYAKEALEHYDEALYKYNSSEWLKPLRVLCEGDRLRVQYIRIANKWDEEQVFDKFRMICNKSEKLSPLFESEFRTTFGKYMVDTGKFDGAKIQFNEATRKLKNCVKSMLDHPLSAYILEREAWSLMDQWKVEEAAKLLIRAENDRETNCKASPQNQQALIYALNDRHGLAMTQRYLDKQHGYLH